jgi:hypothetical protein
MPTNVGNRAQGTTGQNLSLGARGERVRALQRRLDSLGFKVGQVDGSFGMKTLNAVKAFQRSRGLVADGVVGPQTWKKLGLDALDRVIPTSSGGRGGPLAPDESPAPSRLNQARLVFDGSSLCWIWFDTTRPPICWPAVSGRSGYQAKTFQKVKDKGPLPEGAWLVAQGEYQRMPERSLFEQFVNEVGRGSWPGGESSWGRHRIWLKPLPGTQTYGRSGFSVHGGDSPGSAGCIDLTDQLEAFIHMFREYGKDMELTVKYE